MKHKDKTGQWNYEPPFERDPNGYSRFYTKHYVNELEKKHRLAARKAETLERRKLVKSERLIIKPREYARIERVSSPVVGDSDRFVTVFLNNSTYTYICEASKANKMTWVGFVRAKLAMPKPVLLDAPNKYYVDTLSLKQRHTIRLAESTYYELEDTAGFNCMSLSEYVYLRLYSGELAGFEASESVVRKRIKEATDRQNVRAAKTLALKEERDCRASLRAAAADREREWFQATRATNATNPAMLARIARIRLCFRAFKEALRNKQGRVRSVDSDRLVGGWYRSAEDIMANGTFTAVYKDNVAQETHALMRQFGWIKALETQNDYQEAKERERYIAKMDQAKREYEAKLNQTTKDN